MTNLIIEWFFYACAAYGVVATLYYFIEANGWRVQSWFEDRRLDFLIWRRRR